MAKVIERYGARWAAGDSVRIEMACIRKGGRWLDGTRECGAGLAHHYKRFAELVWPGDWWSRWDDLMTEHFTGSGSHSVVGVGGPASSSKTHRFACYGLTMYWCFPHKCTVLCSTTTREDLEMRIWGEVKKYFGKARERYPWLPGHLIESKQMITTDGKEVEGREFRNGLKGVACKKGGRWEGLGCPLRGTKVDTIDGPIPIEKVKPGMLVWTAIGLREVKRCSQRIAKQIVRVSLENGLRIDITPEHPFLTQKGWVNAIDLRSHHLLPSPNETMSVLWQGNYRRFGQEEILQPNLHGKGSEEEVSFLRDRVFSLGSERDVLHTVLRSEMEDDTACHCGSDKRRKKSGRLESGWASNEQGDHGQSSGSQAEGIGRSTQYRPKEVSTDSQIVDRASHAQTKSIWRLWKWINLSNRDFVRDSIPRCSLQFGDSIRKKTCRWISALLQTGFRMAAGKTCGGTRRRNAPEKTAGSEGREENGRVRGIRVDSVEILERSGVNGYSFYRQGYPVHNLEVEGHPSYSVNGVIIHNSYIGVKNDRVLLLADEGQMMEPGFFDAQGNLASNPWSQLLAGGNPNSCDNPFGKLCEPVNGWESVQQGEKTQTWETRHGKCINLVGVDSPNLDYEEGAEPFGKLIGRRYIKKIAHDYGTDSWQYQAWVLARFPVGALERRVITRALCRKFHAQDEPVWGDGPLLKLFALDAAYGGVGGDRCVGVELHVGKGIDGVRRIACAGQPVLIPVNNTKPQLPEEQIVEFVRGYCEPKGIEPQNVAFDGTGRASLMSAFARLWSPLVVTVEFGGYASDRPVRIGDPKLCSEAYDRFVTELWFTCRVCVEADQIRGLPESIVEEFQMRAWKELKASEKVRVEIKSETKERLGKSPDLADAFVTGVELARRRGFEIAKLGAKGLRSDNKWLRDMRDKFEKASKAHELSYS